jgi:nitrogen regulatory protein P-II 1
MVKIEAVIQPIKLDDVKMALESLGIDGITISEVLEHGGPVVEKTFYRGVEYRVDVPRLKLEILVFSHRADEVVEALSRVARTHLSAGSSSMK